MTARSTSRSTSNWLAKRSTSVRASESLWTKKPRDVTTCKLFSNPSSRAAADTRSAARSGWPSAGRMLISQSIAVPFLFCSRFQDGKQAFVIALFQGFADIPYRLAHDVERIQHVLAIGGKDCLPQLRV